MKEKEIVAPTPQEEMIEAAVLSLFMFNGDGAVDLFTKYAGYIDEDCFYNEHYKMIFNAICKLRDSGVERPDAPILFSVLKGKVEATTLASIQSMFTSLSQAQDYINILIQRKIQRKILNEADKMVVSVATEVDPEEIINDAVENLSSLLRLQKKKGVASFEDAVLSAGKEIEENFKGERPTMIPTLYPKLDTLLALKRRTLCLISGDKGGAKTNFLISLMYKILYSKTEFDVLWFSMEDPKEKIVRRFLSIETGLSDRQLLSIGHKIDGDVDRINKAFDDFLYVHNFYRINFVDEQVDIKTMKRIARKQYQMAKDKNRQMIIVVDNLGLIGHSEYHDDIAKENAVAKELAAMRDETDSLIFLVHHLTKGQISQAQLKEGYRPREEFIRGSSRIVDYANCAILVNLPRKYSDLLEMYRKRAEEIPMPKSMSLTRPDFKEYFWVLNPKGDSKWESKQIVDFEEAGYSELYNACMETRLPVMEMYQRYYKYCKYIDSLNDKRDDRFKNTGAAEKVSIFYYMKKKLYDQTFSVDKGGREYYLFGDTTLTPKQEYDMLSSLFIVEATKIRDVDTNMDRVIRYECDLNANKFIEL